MARARNIKPGFFSNEDLAECSLGARLCFAGLWTLADRDGRLEDRPKRIKGELFRFDAFPVEPLLDELAARSFIVRYEIDGSRYIQVSQFSKHQTPHYSEKASAIKGPPLLEKHTHMEASNSRNGKPTKPVVLQDDTKKQHVLKTPPQPPDSLIPDSLIPEVKQAASAQTPTPPPPPFAGDSNLESLNGKAVVQLAEKWELPTQWGMDAEALGWQPKQVLHEAERFRQYWTAGNGNGQRRSVKGWRQAWSNWLSKAERFAR